MSEHTNQPKHTGHKPRSFLERIILGASDIGDISTHKNTEPKNGVPPQSLEVESVITPKPQVVKLPEAGVVKKVLVVESTGSAHTSNRSATHPFDPEALFVPLQSVSAVTPDVPEEGISKPQPAPALDVNREMGVSRYFDFGNGIGVSTVQGLCVYIQNLTQDEFVKHFSQNKGALSEWVFSVNGNEKLAKLILLADTKDEVIAYIDLSTQNSS